MDKLVLYQGAIISFLKEYASIPNAVPTGDVKENLIIDTENNHFQLLSVGWQKNKFIFAPILHFDIVDGKVWIQQNNTEVFVADELMARGIAKDDIVLGFQAPIVRPHTGFAVA